MQSIIRTVFDSFRSFNIYRWLLRQTTPWRNRSWPLVLWGQLFKHYCQKIDIAPWFQMKRGYKPSRWCHVLVVSYCVSLSLATFIGPCFSIYENICIPQGMLKSLEIQRDHEGQTRISLNESKSIRVSSGWMIIHKKQTRWLDVRRSLHIVLCLFNLSLRRRRKSSTGLRLHYHPGILLKCQTLQQGWESWAMTVIIQPKDLVFSH